MLTKLAIWILRKQKKSVMIGVEVNGGSVKLLSNCSLIYDSKLTNIDCLTFDNEQLLIPEGKFNIVRKLKQTKIL